MWYYYYYKATLNLILIGCSGVVYVNGIPSITSITQTYVLSCNTFFCETGRVEGELYYFYRGNELVSRSKSFVYREDSVTGVLNNHVYYSCTVTVNGSNFTSNPALTPTLIRRE
jgi:hypothetical protein